MMSFVDYFKNPPIIVRYLEAGAIAALVNLSTLYFLTDVLGFWYLFSSTVALIVSLVASFLLQKFLTFRNFNKTNIVVFRQIILYLFLNFINLELNIFFVYLLVEKVEIWYLAAQAFSALLIAGWSFVVYQKFIFRD